MIRLILIVLNNALLSKPSVSSALRAGMPEDLLKGS